MYDLALQLGIVEFSLRSKGNYVGHSIFAKPSLTFWYRTLYGLND